MRNPAAPQTDRPSLQHEGDSLIVRVPMRFKRRGGRKEIIVPEGLEASAAPPRNEDPLVVALARAHHWQDLLDSGRYPSVTALADALGVCRTYVARILRLTLLAPGVVESILEGREPAGTTVDGLARLPMAWAEQRERLGLVE